MQVTYIKCRYCGLKSNIVHYDDDYNPQDLRNETGSQFAEMDCHIENHDIDFDIDPLKDWEVEKTVGMTDEYFWSTYKQWLENDMITNSKTYIQEL
jgi:hypothetical protein